MVILYFNRSYWSDRTIDQFNTKYCWNRATFSVSFPNTSISPHSLLHEIALYFILNWNCWPDFFYYFKILAPSIYRLKHFCLWFWSNRNIFDQIGICLRAHIWSRSNKRLQPLVRFAKRRRVIIAWDNNRRP